jgi:predicted alpha/beta-hydrolase family hydrolase
MNSEPEKLTVSVSERDDVTALLYLAPKKNRAGVTLILGHGAGAGQLSPFMRLFATGLAERGLDTLTFNFLYMEQGRHVPDPAAKLESCYRAVIEAATKHKKLKGNRVVIGGKSMGGRIASQVAATLNSLECGGLTPLSNPDPKANSKSKLRNQKSSDRAVTGATSYDIAALVFIGYPLHPPGRPDKLRDAHLNQIKAPMLFIQGSRDAFGSTDEIRDVIKRLKLPATLHAIEGGDHSLKVPKSAGVPQDQVYESTMDELSRWLRTQVATW